MRINARLHRITNLHEFVQSFIATSGKPTKGFTDFGRARVHLATDMPAGKFADEASFFPPISLKTDANAKGSFSFDVPEGMAKFRGYLIAYEQVGVIQPSFENVPAVPIFAPIYRSEAFKLSAVTDPVENIFVQPRRTDDPDGFSQKDLDEVAGDLKKDHKLERVSANVKDGKVSCRVEERGAVGTFDLRLRPSTSHDLGRFVELKAEEIEIDLPGPDFIVGICVSEDDIKKQLRKMIAARSSTFNEVISQSIPQAVRGIASITVNQVRFPVTGHKTIKILGGPEQQVPTRSIVPDVTVGVPRKLY